MRSFFIPTIAILGLLAVPAFAQSNSSSSSKSGASSGSPPNGGQIEQELHQDLSKAGFTDIHIMPGSFMVHAKNSKGQLTEMMVNPNSMTEVTAMNSSPSSSQSDAATGSSSSTKK